MSPLGTTVLVVTLVTVAFAKVNCVIRSSVKLNVVRCGEVLTENAPLPAPGTTVSMVMLRGWPAALVPVALVAVAVMTFKPFVAKGVVVMAQLPSPPATTEPTSTLSANNLTVTLAPAVPEKVGVVSLVTLSTVENPVSDPTARSGALGDEGKPTTEATAAAAFTRPPVTVMPANDASGSTVVNRAVFICAIVRPGERLNISAATPATCGEAIDVPVKN